MNPPPIYDFSQPQRQSKVGIVVAWVLLLKKYIRLLSAAFLYALVKLPWTAYIWLFLGIILVLIILAGFAYLSYRNMTFYLDDVRDEFVLSKGIFNKEKIIVQLDKITQVNMEQHFAQQLVQVYEINIDTGGSAQTEVAIPALDRAVALQLKQTLLKHISMEDVEGEELPNTFSIPNRNILLHALTADYFRNLLFLVAISFSFIDKVVNVADTIEQDVESYEYQLIEIWDSLHISIVILAILCIPILFNIMKLFIQYFKYSVQILPASIVMSYGLINKLQTIIQKDRCQLFIIKQQPLQQLLGIEKVTITQLSADIDYDQKAKVQLPGSNSKISSRLFEVLFHDDLNVPNVHFLEPNILIVIKPLILWVIMPTALFFLLYLNEVIHAWYAMWLLLLIPILIGVAYRSYTNSRFYVSEKLLCLQEVEWMTTKTYTQVHKITQIQVKQYPWQRKSNKGSILLSTAGGKLAFATRNYKEAIAWANVWLYLIESTEEHPVST